jgi:hypothetical protein
VRHAERPQYQVVHQFNKRQAGDFLGQQLGHAEAAEGIAPLGDGHRVDQHRFVVRRASPRRTEPRSTPISMEHIVGQGGLVEPPLVVAFGGGRLVAP